MITGKIILKSATKLSLDKRFTEIAKQAPVTPPRIQQQANVIIPYSKQELFGNKRPNVLNIAQRLKKRSINYRLGLGANANGNRLYRTPNKPRVFQRLSYTNRRRMDTGGNNSGANRFLFGGQSGMGIRLRGQGRIRGARAFRPRTRGYLNNNTISRYSGYSMRGNRNNRGRRNTNNNNNFNRSNRGRFGKNSNRGRGRNNNNNNNNKNFTKESLDTDIDKYMAQTKIENDSIEMNAI
ncbi:unnamed protein product [Rotaria sp. Silwood2]|nr:unnamed protein product [Rotaria sp. Silwood2]CAF3116532.1 unnamed protein product [Rotaria sp. Silwood2]CAF3371455.1 unnamed protein product [Rotaria sp. Silwood2]CAF4058663.1 unnamed protein product [Rotaria sp. Silwood2]CAF4190178.1 unnamed protein product [Rotaria sp. Silwood2]